MAHNAKNLDDILRSGRMRIVHMIVLVGAIMLAISIAAAVYTAPTIRDLPQLVVWFLGCTAFCVVGRIWYRMRVRASHRIRKVIETRATVYSINTVSLSINFVPFGHEVQIDYAADDTSAERVTICFWTADTAEILLKALQDNPVGKAPPLTFMVAAPTRGPAIPKARK